MAGTWDPSRVDARRKASRKLDALLTDARDHEVDAAYRAGVTEGYERGLVAGVRLGVRLEREGRREGHR